MAKKNRVIPCFLRLAKPLFVFSFAKMLYVDGLAQLLPSDDALLGEFLSLTDLFLHTNFVEFLFQFLERFVDRIAFFNGNNNHKKYLFLLGLILYLIKGCKNTLFLICSIFIFFQYYFLKMYSSGISTKTPFYLKKKSFRNGCLKFPFSPVFFDHSSKNCEMTMEIIPKIQPQLKENPVFCC